MTPINPMREQTAPPQNNPVQDFGDDNVVTRAEQGHLTLLDWQTENPLRALPRPSKVRRAAWNWDMAGILLLMASAALAAADLLAHLAP